jgi:hypothetical protein
MVLAATPEKVKLLPNVVSPVMVVAGVIITEVAFAEPIARDVAVIVSILFV